MKKPGRPPCLLDVVVEHFEELDFLWEQREGVIFAPDWTLAELAALEARAEAHLDGLRVAERHAVDLVRPALSGEQTFAATAATFVLMEARDPGLEAEVIAALEAAETPELRDGIRIGLRHSRLGDDACARLVELSASGDVATAIAAADVLAFQRMAFAGLAPAAMRAERTRDRVLVLEVFGRRRELDEEGQLRAALDDPESEVRTAALRAAAQSGLPQLARYCRDLAKGGSVGGDEAIAMLGVVGDATDLDQLLAGVSQGDSRGRAALQALGALGRIEAAPHLLAKLDDEALARSAANALTRITGLAIDDLAADAGSQTDRDDDDAPRPDFAQAVAGWERIRDRFEADARWQAGIRVDGFGPFVDLLPLAIRRDLHLSYAARSATEHAVPELEALARRQAG